MFAELVSRYVGPEAILATFFVFCRIGACLMVIPGFSTQRVNVRIRLFIALTVTLALAPNLVPQVRAVMPDETLATVARFIFTELYVGFFIGILGRIMFLALETMGALISMAIGMSNMPGVPTDGGDAIPPVANLLVLSATAVVFITNQHLELFRALTASYTTLIPGEGFGAATGLERVVDQMSMAFVLALRVCSPFILYTVVVNLALGLINKLTPQIPVYFVSMPFVIAGGLYFMFLLSSHMIALFVDGYVTWLQAG